MNRTVRRILSELIRTLLLIAGLAVVVAVFTVACFPARRPDESFVAAVVRFLAQAHRDRAGFPLWPTIAEAASATLAPAAAAIGLLIALASTMGTLLAVSPWGRLLKPVVVAASVVPSFLWPFVGYLIDPSLPFHGFQAQSSVLWPALALAVGDMNWITVAGGFSDSLRKELAEPHTRIARVLGQHVLWQVWPRALVGLIGAVAARIPHLLGGMVAIEVLFNIPGLGYLVWKSILATPPDYTVVLWVCVLGILVSRVLSWTHEGVAHWLLSSRGPAPRTATLEESDTDSAPVEATAGEFQRPALPQPARVVPPAPATALPTEAGQRPSPPGSIPWRVWISRSRFYLGVHPAHWGKLGIAVWIWSLSLVALVALGMATASAPPSPASGALQQFRPPEPEHPLGTNAADDDVLQMIAAGLRQQALPILLAVLMSGAAAPFAACGLLSKLVPSRGLSLLFAALDRLLAMTAALVESIPRIVILLAGFYAFDSAGLMLKLYCLIGIAFFPQMYRTVRDDLAVLGTSLFLESSRVAGVSWWTTFRENVLRNHTLQTAAVQAAAIAGSVIQADAMLGFLGVRNRGVVLTWGSVLGTGISEFLTNRPLEGVKAGFWFNDCVVWGPFAAIWLAVLTMATLADALRIPATGYVYRLKSE
jgi:ABC-type dipeptide/oligopeptide/nickel transport system permease component